MESLVVMLNPKWWSFPKARESVSQTQTPITDELAEYIRQVTVREPEALRRLREETESHPHSSLQTVPEQGQFLHLLARITGAKKTLEVGVFMGYSSTWVALALPPGGKVVACDHSEEYTARARQTWREAGVEDKIDLRLAPALETLDAMIAGGESGAFDLAFIDADKENYANYYERALVLVRQGGLIADRAVLSASAREMEWILEGWLRRQREAELDEQMPLPFGEQ